MKLFSVKKWIAWFRNHDDSKARDLSASRRSFLGKGFLAAFGSGLLVGTRSGSAQDTSRASGSTAAPEIRSTRQSSQLNFSTKTEQAWRNLNKEASPEDLYRFLYALPKGGDIHHHLGGGLLPEMIWDVATDSKRNGGQTFYTRVRISSLNLIDVGDMRDSRNISGWVTISNHTLDRLSSDVQKDFKQLSHLNDKEKRAWMDAMFLDKNGEGRDEFFEYIWNRLGDILQSIDVMTELLVENMKRFGAEGVRYLEIQARFRGWTDSNGKTISDDEATRRFLDRFDQPDAKATGVLVRFQTIVLRFSPDAIEGVEKYFEYAYNNPELWLGINLAGREDDNRGYPSKFTDVFDRMIRKFPGVGISIHAGEAEKKDTHIFDTLRLGATRIGHGINLFRDPSTMQMMRGENFLIEINLISNHLLGYTPDLDEHPFPIYMRQGIPCCLNTDDRGMWHSNMTDEYFVAVSRFNLTWKEMITLGENSLKHSFLDDQAKARLLQDYHNDINAFQDRLENQGWKSIVRGSEAVTYDYGKKHLKLNLS